MSQLKKVSHTQGAKTKMIGKTVSGKSFKGLADALHVSPRMLVRLGRIYSKAVELYEGNEEAALAWLKRRNKALGGVPPVDLIKTEAGALQVEHLIGRLEHGVYS